MSAPSNQPNSRLTLDRSASRVPLTAHHCATPSNPWRWMYPGMDIKYTQSCYSKVIPGIMEDWRGHPQCLFPEWTPDRVERSGMFLSFEHVELCTVHEVDMMDDGDSKLYHISHADGNESLTTACWNWLQAPRPARVRILFVENMTSQVLQMLGTKYNIDPSFFLSSANWMSSGYQDDPKPQEGDHITIVLPFIRVERESTMGIMSKEQQAAMRDEMGLGVADTPLILRDGIIIQQDLLAIHMVRTTTMSTLISYHPCSKLHGMSATRLRSVVKHHCNRAHWSKTFSTSKDPTFVLIAMFRHVLQAWDEVFEELYDPLYKLENNDIWDGEVNLRHIRDLYELQAHVLHYRHLLQHLHKSVTFVGETPNPAMDAESISNRDLRFSTDLMKKEVTGLLSEICRLEEQRLMWSGRLENAISLIQSISRIERHHMHMQRVTGDTERSRTWWEAGVFDVLAFLYGWLTSTTQTVYFLMVFFPVHLSTRVFGAQTVLLNPSGGILPATYIGTSIAMILGVFWLAIALWDSGDFYPVGSSMWRRLMWPVYSVYNTTIRIIRRTRWRTLLAV